MVEVLGVGPLVGVDNPAGAGDLVEVVTGAFVVVDLEDALHVLSEGLIQMPRWM